MIRVSDLISRHPRPTGERESSPPWEYETQMTIRPTDAASVQPTDVVLDMEATPSQKELLAQSTVIAARSGYQLWEGFLADIVRNATGLVYAEAWVRDCFEREATLRRPTGGWYLEPAFDCGAHSARPALRRLKEQCSSVRLGCGLAGELWEDAAVNSHDGPGRWHALEPMARNEDAPSDARKDAAAEVFGSVAAIPLRVDGTLLGLVLVFSRPAVRGAPAGFEHPANLEFLGACQRIGNAILASEQPRSANFSAKRARSNGFRKLRSLTQTGMLVECVRRERERLDNGSTKLAPECRQRGFDAAALLQMARVQVGAYLRKFGGSAGAIAPQAPPWHSRDAWVAAGWTWLGVASTLLCLSALNQLTLRVSEGDYRLLIGSFGALMTLLYGAPSSPLGQPKNVIFGNTVAAMVAVGLYYLSGEAFLGVVPGWVMCALAPATAIALMQRTALLHPPAGAAALIFVSGPPAITDLGWMYLVMPLLVGNIVCICMAMIINNLSRKRQYPLWWA
jgi:hypothetical protein